MEDTSFFSGLSDMEEAIGESSYGRCITFWITSCEPPAESVCIRLGGPGSEWHTVVLPMTRPLTIHRASCVRVLRRVTELAVATPAFVQSPAAESDELHVSSQMAAMDVLTSTASSAAGSTVISAVVGAVEANVGDAPDTELVAAAVAQADGEDAKDSQAPLRVHFRWAVGDVLPGAPLSVEATEFGAAPAASLEFSEDEDKEEEGGTELHVTHSDSNSFENSQNAKDAIASDILGVPPTYRTPFDEVGSVHEQVAAANDEGHNTDTPFAKVATSQASSTELGDEDSTPDHSAFVSPIKSNSAPAPSEVEVPGLSKLHHDTGADEIRPSVTTKTSTIVSNPFIDDDDRDEYRESEDSSHPPHPSLPSSNEHPAGGSVPIRSQSPFSNLPSSLALPPHGFGNSTEAKDSVAVSFNDNESAPPHRELSTNVSGGYSARFNTPRRQRPRSARRSTVQMDLAPVMANTFEHKTTGDDGARSCTTAMEDSVHISDPDEVDLAQHEMHLPPPPAGKDHHVPEQSQQPAQPVSAHMLHFASNTPVERTTIAAVPSTPVPASPSTKPHPSVANLFEGAAASDLLVTVAVVAVVNTKGATDPHRVVSVSLNARAAAASDAGDSVPANVSFQTAPTLRSLAAVLPQLSSPTLLYPLRHSGNTASEKKQKERDKPALLHAACTVTESIAANTATAATSTVLWTTNVDVEVSRKTLYLSSPPSSSSSCSAPVMQEVRFDGANGDVVVTQWTYLTVGAYRDAALNLHCRSEEPGQPTLQLLLIADDKRSQRSKITKGHHVHAQTSVAVHLWVSAAGTPANALQHRLAAAATVHSPLLQPVHVTMQDPLGCVAVHVPQLQYRRSAAAGAAGSNTAKAAFHVEPIFLRGFSVEWTRATALKHPSLTLYYRIVAPAASKVLPTLAPQLPSPFHETLEKNAEAGSDSRGKVLREMIVTIRPPVSLLTNASTMSYSATTQATPSLLQQQDNKTIEASAVPSSSTSAWTLVLRHAVTHAVLAESTISSTSGTTAASALTYRCFLPLTLEDAAEEASSSKCQQRASESTPTNLNAAALSCLAWEVVLISAASAVSVPSAAMGYHLPTPPSNRAARRNSRSAMHGTMTDRKHVGDVEDSTATWTGLMMLPHAQLYAADGAVANFKVSLCVSAPSAGATNTSALQSAATLLGAQVEVHCEMRRHPLDAQSAVFCLRSLRLVSSPVGNYITSPAEVASSPSAPQPSNVRLWFTTSGSSAEELQAAWAAAAQMPSEKDVQRAWVPSSTSLGTTSSSCCSPRLRTDAHGQLVATGVPVLMSTDNVRARLCVAVTPATASSTAPECNLSNKLTREEAEEEALRRCVVAVRKRAIHRYKKRSKQSPEGDDDADVANAHSPAAVAGMYLECLNAVAMRMANYAEVDLQSSLVASNEFQGHSRHRLLLSSVSGTVRLNRNVVLELQGRWIKLPRKVAHLSESYTPSPRLWALRCSCVVRRTGDEMHDTYQSTVNTNNNIAAATSDSPSGGMPLAQKVLQAERGYVVTAHSVPLDYSDPSEETVQKVLPGLSYDKLVVQMKQADRSLQPYRETITTSTTAGALRKEDEDAAASEETGDLLDHIFGPTGVAHAAYMSHTSHKIAVVHFVFGDAYTTRTVLNVTFPAVGAAATASSTPYKQLHQHSGYHPTPLSAHPSPPPARLPSPPTVQVVCDSLMRSATLYSFLPESVVTKMFPGVSHHRYPPELTWYHGGLGIDATAEQQRREEAQQAWQRGLTERSLGPQQKPGPLVVSAVTHHPYESLPLVVESSLTRCLDGRALFVFGGVSTTTGAASSRAFVLDVSSQQWLPLKARRGSHGAEGTNSTSSTILPRYGHAAVFRPADEAVYVFGGRGSPETNNNSSGACDRSRRTRSSAVFSDVWRLEWSFDTATLRCTELICTVVEAPSFTASTSSLIGVDSGRGGLARWRHAAVLHDDYLIVLGGLSGSGACCSCRDLLYLDMRTWEWCVRRSFGNDAPSPRYGHAAAVSDSTSLYLFGGWTDGEGGKGASNSFVTNSDNTGSSSSSPVTTLVEEDSVDGAVAVADFYKMDLITRMWTRVAPNGTLRPPALELADMTACKLDDCPVLFLVGGRTPEGSFSSAACATDVDPDDAPSTQLEVFLFSTATLFWRRVKMDCTPVPTRFGLRAVVSAAATVRSTHGSSADAILMLNDSTATTTTRLRRSLPARGQRVGDIVIVGGLPLEETAVVETSPAITLVLAAGNGSGKGIAAAATAAALSVSRAASAGQRTTDLPTARSPSVNGVQCTPRLPSVPRGPADSAPRRPATGPPRPTPHRPAPPPKAPHRPVPPALAWTQQQQQRRVDDCEDDFVTNLPIAVVTRSPLAIRKSVNRLYSVPSPGRRAAALPLNPERPSCYSTLTRRQQRQLVRRLYTNDLQVRAAHRETLEEQVYLERTTPVFQSGRSHLPAPQNGTATAISRPARVSSAPFQRPVYDATLNATPAAADSSEMASNVVPAPAARRELCSEFLRRSSHSSSTVSTAASPSSSFSSSSSSSSSSTSPSSSLSSSKPGSAVSAEERPQQHNDKDSFVESNERSATEEDTTPLAPFTAASEKSSGAHSEDEKPESGDDVRERSSHRSERQKTESDEEKRTASVAAAVTVEGNNDGYDDSFAPSSSAEEGEEAGDYAAEDAKPAPLSVHVPPIPMPFSVELHDTNSDSSQNNKNPTSAALAATLAGKSVVEHNYTPPQYPESASHETSQAAHVEHEAAGENDSGADKADEEKEEVEKKSSAEQSYSRSPLAALDDNKAKGKRENDHDELAAASAKNAAPRSPLVPPIADESNNFNKVSNKGASDPSAEVFLETLADPEGSKTEESAEAAEEKGGENDASVPQQRSGSVSFTPLAPEPPMAAADDNDEAEDVERFDSAPVSDRATSLVNAPEQQSDSDHRNEDKEVKSNIGPAADAYEDDEDEWESLFDDDDEAENSTSCRAKTPFASETEGKEAPAPPPADAIHGEKKEKNSNDDDGNLTPSPEFSPSSPPNSVFALAAPPPARYSSSDEFEKASDEDSTVSKVRSNTLSEAEEVAEPAVLAESIASSVDHSVSAPALSDVETEKEINELAPHLSNTSEASDADEEDEAYTEPAVETASEEDNENDSVVSSPRAAQIDASSSDTYDTGFGDAAEAGEKEEEEAVLAVLKPLTTPPVSEDSAFEEPEAPVQLASAVASEEGDNMQRGAEAAVCIRKPSTTSNSTEASEAEEGNAEAAEQKTPPVESLLSLQHERSPAVPGVASNLSSESNGDDLGEAPAVKRNEEVEEQKNQVEDNKAPSTPAASVHSGPQDEEGKFDESVEAAASVGIHSMTMSEEVDSAVALPTAQTPLLEASAPHDEPASLHSADEHVALSEMSSLSEYHSENEAENETEASLSSDLESEKVDEAEEVIPVVPHTPEPSAPENLSSDVEDAHDEDRVAEDVAAAETLSVVSNSSEVAKEEASLAATSPTLAVESRPSTAASELLAAVPSLESDAVYDAENHNDTDSDKEDRYLSDAAAALSEKSAPATPPPENNEGAEKNEEEDATWKQLNDDDNHLQTPIASDAASVDSMHEQYSNREQVKEITHTDEEEEGKSIVSAAPAAVAASPSDFSSIHTATNNTSADHPAQIDKEDSAYEKQDAAAPVAQDALAAMSAFASQHLPTLPASEHPSRKEEEHEGEEIPVHEITAVSQLSTPPTPSPPQEAENAASEKTESNEDKAPESSGMAASLPVALAADLCESATAKLKLAPTPLSIIDSEKDEEEEYAEAAEEEDKAPLETLDAEVEEEAEKSGTNAAADGEAPRHSVHNDSTPSPSVAAAKVPQAISDVSKVYELSPQDSLHSLLRDKTTADDGTRNTATDVKDAAPSSTEQLEGEDVSVADEGDPDPQHEGVAASAVFGNAEPLGAFRVEEGNEPPVLSPNSTISTVSESAESAEEKSEALEQLEAEERAPAASEGNDQNELAEGKPDAAAVPHFSPPPSAVDAPVGPPHELAEESDAEAFNSSSHRSDHEENAAGGAASELGAKMEHHGAASWHVDEQETREANGDAEDRDEESLQHGNEKPVSAPSAQETSSLLQSVSSAPALKVEEEASSAEAEARYAAEHSAGSSAAHGPPLNPAESLDELSDVWDASGQASEGPAAATPLPATLHNETSETEERQEETSENESLAVATPNAPPAGVSNVESSGTDAAPAALAAAAPTPAAETDNEATPTDELDALMRPADDSQEDSTPEANTFVPPALQEDSFHESERKGAHGDATAEAEQRGALAEVVSNGSNTDELFSLDGAAAAPLALHEAEVAEPEELSLCKSLPHQVENEGEGKLAVTLPSASTPVEEGEAHEVDEPRDAKLSSASELDVHDVPPSYDGDSNGAPMKPFVANTAAAGAPRNDNESDLLDVDETEAEAASVSLETNEVPAALPLSAGAVSAENEQGGEWGELGSTPVASNHDNLFAPIAAGASPSSVKADSEEDEFSIGEDAQQHHSEKQLGNDKNDAEEHVSWPKATADEWGEVLTSPPESQPPTSNSPVAMAPVAFDGEEEETTEETPDTALNGSRDLLDRRRGVEEEVQDDDFDF